jgi:aliphatic nitrilase
MGASMSESPILVTGAAGRLGGVGGEVVDIRQHALEAGCFVVCATAWLVADQQARIMQDTGCVIGPISGGCFTAIVSPEGGLLGTPLRSGEG